MGSQGRFKKELSLSDLTFIGFGAIFGSGWLFAASQVASIAGPSGWISWVAGGFAVILLGLVYAELGAAVPRAGGIVRYPVYSHGPLMGYLIGFITLIAFSSLIAIEVEAARQYAASWWPALSKEHSSLPTVLGWFVQLALLAVFFLLNYWSVKTFAKTNTIITIFKFFVPALTIIVLLTQIKSVNFSVENFAPFGLTGIEGAISTGGVIFAYLGLQPIVSVASEAKNPQKTVPIALILSVVLSTIVYVLLQIVFVGSIPTDMISGGWGQVNEQFNLPFKDIAVVLGMGWLAVFIVIDAIISPSGTGNIYMSSTSRVVYGWARNRTLFKIFARVDDKTGIPRPSLWLTFLMSVFWTLPFPSWSALISVVSAALVLSYAVAPISAGAFRRNAPDLQRPFHLKAMGIIGPLSFIVASLIVYWSGWRTISWLLGSQLVMFVIYLFFKKVVPTDQVSLAQQVKSSWWLVFYYVMMMAISYLGSFGGSGVLENPLDMVIVAFTALITYYWGVFTCLPKAIFDDDDIEATGPVVSVKTVHSIDQ
ncbi:aspartate/glutamate:proton symporter (AGT family) [Scopulibacillus darangshiensis]|uniref:Aspartate/glutamate:proton symporter (AGT family) n=1 Tax=Scopulibacillus darangshiensis TaxID=442528 RepID=A0A4R2NNZ3_9BACL|nr:APC family permease [Scopulibacillus darangshiensis]TCP23450.1 aspartate/glutamate:proton symporter (AGT family) [Scopulibacillus darangshiensis]